VTPWAFSTWALTSDHLSSVLPFKYRPHVHRSESFSKLNSYANTHSHLLKTRLNYTDDNTTLYPLCRGFEVLAKILDNLRQEASDGLRPDDELPDSAEFSTLETLPFKHRETFLDLTEASHARSLDYLGQAVTDC
jgi:hypothetical protein